MARFGRVLHLLGRDFGVIYHDAVFLRMSEVLKGFLEDDEICIGYRTAFTEHLFGNRYASLAGTSNLQEEGFGDAAFVDLAVIRPTYDNGKKVFEILSRYGASPGPVVFGDF
jgi:hypothetical protein